MKRFVEAMPSNWKFCVLSLNKKTKSTLPEIILSNVVKRFWTAQSLNLNWEDAAQICLDADGLTKLAVFHQ